MKNYSNWMTDNLKSLGKQTIKKLTLPASHDSGMSTITQSAAFSNNCNTQTQSYNFTEQLNAGIRYFDLRPIIGGGKFYAGHYSQLTIGEEKVIVGSRGLLLDEFISQVNDFTKNHKELIIINISHAYNTDDHRRKGKKGWCFNSSEWKSLVDRLKLVNNRCNMDIHRLSDKYLEDFVGTEKSVLMCFKDASISLESTEGMYDNSILNIKGGYSNTIDVKEMSCCQIKKMANHYKEGSNAGLFKISWTLTMQFQQALAASVHPKKANSIQYYAKEAWSHIDKLSSKIEKGIYPNFISLDYIDSNITEMCINSNLSRV